MATFSQTVTAGANDGALNGASSYNAGITAFNLGQFAGVIGSLAARFTSVTIPKGAVITSALLSVYVTGTANNPISIIGKVADTADAAMPASYAAFNSAAKTAGTAYSKTWTANSGYNTVDITNEVQSLVNRSDWASGNAMVVYLLDNGSVSGKTVSIDMFEGNAAHAPMIDIVYTVPQSGPPGHAFSAGGGHYQGNRRSFVAGGLNLGGF